MPDILDCIVIGGGLAGIAATQRLADAGQRVALVEARSRFGGRVLTVRLPGLAHALELGPEWFDGFGPIQELLVARSHPMPEATGRFVVRSGDQLRDLYEIPDGGYRIHRRLSALRGRDISLARALRECCENEHDRAAAEALRRYVEGFHAADPEQLSLARWNQVERVQSADVSQHRSPDGLDVAVSALLAQIRASATVFLGTTVQGVRWKRGAVSVDCTTGSFSGTLRAAKAIITLPLAVLQLPASAPGAVRFTPALSTKRAALRQLAMGAVLKVNLVFDSPFWRDLPGLNDALFVQDATQPIPTWWSARPLDAPVLVGWAAGPQVKRAGSTRNDALLRTAVKSLAHALGIAPRTVKRRLSAWCWHDWQHDPLTRGGYSWVRAGGLNAHLALAEPVATTLYFAGEATRGDGYNATMDGAIQSGWRAAREVLER